MASGLQFVQSALVLTGALSAAAALALWMVETGPDEGLEGTRRRLGGGWRALAQAPWAAVPRCATGWLAARLDGLVGAGFSHADEGVAFGGLVFGLVLVFVPVAAAVNALIGGSPFLFWYCLLLAAGFALLNFSGESKRLWPVNAVIAVFLGLSVMIVVPVYVARAFTEVTINNVFSHGVLKSPLVAVFWYVAAYGIGLALDTALRLAGVDPDKSAAQGAVRGFLAALPVAYVLTFVALLAGHLAVSEQSPHRSWQLVLVSSGLAAAALPLTLRVLAWGAARTGAGAVIAAYGAALAAATVLSLLLAYGIHWGSAAAVTWDGAVNVLRGLSADGRGLNLGPHFWVSHLPFLPVAGFLAAMVSAAVAKTAVHGVEAVVGPAAAVDRPFLNAAVSCGGIAVLLWGGAVLV